MAHALLYRTNLSQFLCFINNYCAVEGSVRLRGGSSPWGGRVEIFTGGQWGVVGAGRWGEEEASVVCRQLGFGGVQVYIRYTLSQTLYNIVS